MQGFSEYKSCEYLIKGLERNGLGGVALLAIHECAHAVERHRFGNRANGDIHGRRFQAVYRELLEKYFTMRLEMVGIRGEMLV